jgi:xylulokinase
MFIKDYIRYLLTDEWKTDHIEAQGSLMFDNINWGWSPEICAMGGIPLHILPPLIKPTDVAGYITKKASDITGIKEGTPVVNGASDTALENYCVGAIKPGFCVVKMATAGTVNVFNKEAHPNPKALTYSHVVDGLWYTCLATSSAAHSLRWYRDVFCKEELKIEKKGGIDVYKLLDQEAKLVTTGSEGLIFSPYLMGERSPYWDSKLRGSFIGITAHHERGHFNRAILEGVAYSIKDNFVLAEELADIKEVSFVGGGAKSPLWRSILANVLNKPILKNEKDDSSFGSAMLAGVGIGVFSSHEDAISKSVHLSEVVLPNAEEAEIYEKQFVYYKKVHDSLAEIYHIYE